MNAVTVIQPPQAQVPTFTMSDMERVALAIAKGGLFGSTDPNAVLTLCMLAQAEGQHPAVVFRDYHIISGKPAKKAEAMHRDFLAAGGKIEWHRCDDECADATFSHPQGGSMRITWDNARVAQAQLTGNAMHKKYPRQMKRSRVISEGVRSVFPMATSGLYETGEVQDIVADKPTGPNTPEPQRARDLKPEAKDDKARGKAEAWVRDQLATVENASDLDALDAIIAGGSRAVAKLARDHADLHQQVQAAYEAKAQKLQGYGNDGTLALGSPNAGEGPADSQRGDQFDGTDDTPPWQAKADEIDAMIANAIGKASWDAAKAEFLKHADALPKDVADALEVKLADRRAEVGA